MKTNWNGLAANILKAELKSKRFTYDQIQQKLLTIGVNKTTNGIKAKLGRGAFRFAFFLQCAAISLKNLSLVELNSHESE